MKYTIEGILHHKKSQLGLKGVLKRVGPAKGGHWEIVRKKE